MRCNLSEPMKSKLYSPYLWYKWKENRKYESINKYNDYRNVTE